ncbi:carbonic anhydrase [Lutibacter sp. B2]|nr:carbonic anhydrase [Lutibacter sp. B2]
MEELFDGVKEFSNQEFEQNKLLFQKLSKKQSPHTLFISCSDSRVVPNLITKSVPGDLFIIRNIANIVPPYRKSSEYLSTTSAIEYAVIVLKVKNIVVCGHSNCGGCSALYAENELLNTIPHTKKWLELAKPAKEKVEKLKAQFNYDSTDWLLEQENIVLQISHLLSYPFIKEQYKNKSLNIYGWYYDIENGIVYNYNKSKKIFERIE